MFNNLFKKLSLKTRIFFLVTLVVIASFLAVVWVGSARTVQMAKKDAFDLAQETAEKYRNGIKAELQGARIAAETLATVFETLKRRSLTDREMMNDILRSALEKKDYITAFCVAYDPDALDGRDSRYAGQKPYNATGRYSPYWNKLDGSIRVQPLEDVDIADWYVIPKKTGREYITDPYPYSVQGRPVMLASMVFPIVHDGKAIGVVTSDIVLDKLQEMVTRVNPRGRGGFTEIISNSGVIVANPDDRYLGKDLADTTAYEALRTNRDKTGEVIRNLEQYIAEGAATDQAAKLVDNLKAYASGRSGVGLDISLFTPELSGKILESFDAAREHLARVKEAVGTGHSLVATGRDFHTVYMPIQLSGEARPWSVAVSVPMREVLKNADGISRYAFGMSLLAICVIALILYLIARSVTWPLLRLAESAERIGAGEVGTRIPEVGGGKEISALAGALRFMTGRNKELIGELQSSAAELKEKNQYLNRLNELKDEFLANTSHELRTPIHGIIGIAESMVDGSTGPLTREQEYNLAIITNSGKRLSNMINDILDFTKLKNREITLHPKPVDLKTIADTVLVLSRPLIRGKDLRLTNDVDDCFPPVDADENRIQQILYNLIGNAVRFTEKGLVRVTAEVRGGMAAVSVSDTGIGIPADKLDKVFESFEQVDGSVIREHGGTGLGLPITRKLVELHGGVLTLESKVGEGSVFTFTMPLSNGGDGAICHVARAEPILDLEKYSGDDGFADDFGATAPVPALAENGDVSHRILAVDDEPVNIQVLRNLLRIRNCSITAAHSGAEALRLVESGEQFDLVLLDVMMPKMSGYEVCRQLRLNYSLFELPILMLTAKNRLQDIVLGFQSGANDYLSKPFDREELLARVQTLLSLKKAVRTAIHNERLFENEKQMRVLEQTLLEVTNAITSTLDLKEVLAKVLDAMSHFIHFSKSAVVLNDEDVEERFEVAVVGGGDSGVIREGMPIFIPGDEFLGRTASSGRIVVGDDLASSFHDWRGVGETLVGVPMQYHDVLLGFIVLSCPEADVSHELLFTLAGQAGVAIQNARLFTKINIMATTDGLTGLYNRRHFFELVEKEYAKHRRLGDPLSVCMMDIDYFKKVNDRYGHAVGDEVLRHLAGKLKEMLREYDIVGRYGGEEFAVVFPETPIDVAAKVVERIRARIENSVVETEEFGAIRYTLSMGVSAFTKDGGNISSIFDEADKCLYEAKNSGRNRIVVKRS